MFFLQKQVPVSENKMKKNTNYFDNLVFEDEDGLTKEEMQVVRQVIQDNASRELTKVSEFPHCSIFRNHIL